MTSKMLVLRLLDCIVVAFAAALLLAAAGLPLDWLLHVMDMSSRD